ncbi:hypothetical protein HOF65_03400 [bacterium]|jgi:hypothetical protein|nr:hypothetical protein [bacterium]MBT4633102.1 hypothetical protein [bacterium]
MILSQKTPQQAVVIIAVSQVKLQFSIILSFIFRNTINASQHVSLSSK